jgi:RNA 2',3'-cyclic 3'-phosphodiesterase
MEDIRAFIAVEIPAEIKQKLAEIEEKLRSRKYPAKWVAADSIHLTLKFLGNISLDTVPKVRDVMEEASLYVPSFQIGINGLGVFPNLNHVQIIWAGVSGDLARLIELQKNIDSGLEKLGFTPESRPFTAHLTLARIRDEASNTERDIAGKMVNAVQFEAGNFKVESVSLIKSELRREGPLYTRIASIPFLP